MTIELRSLTHAFGSQKIFERVSVALPPAQTLALIGPSGGGKSTLLRLLAGLIVPDAGEILIENRAVPRAEKELRNYRRHLGLVFQAYNLFPHLTSLANVMLPLTAAHNRTAEEAQLIAEELLARLGLQDHRHKHPAQLSGGQRQRVAIARALAIRPRLLLLDEPTSALDPEMTAEVLDLIEELKSGGTPFVIVTHAMGFARRVADHVAFVGAQNIIEHNSAAEFFSAPKTEPVQRFLERVLKY
jgi:polar amino acid transport system ATP-binding protein